MKYRTIILSDIHLGSAYSMAREVTKFLGENDCDKLILNGDIIDGWALDSGSKWKAVHTECFGVLLDYASRMDVYWVRGNHDDFLAPYLPFEIGGMKVVEDVVHVGLDGVENLVLHGDIFDIFVKDMKWVSHIGGWIYEKSLWVNKWYNVYRRKRGLKYYSISKLLKDSVKGAVKYVGNFEEHMSSHVRELGYGGVICGHIHKAEIREIDGIRYMNSGDWMESGTALVEAFDGKWSIVNYLG